MKHVTIASAALLAALATVPATARTSGSQPRNQQATAVTDAQEVYHVHFVKAAPGKLPEMIDAYVNAPADPNASAPPLILRHVEGDDWDLLVLTPMGKEDKVTAGAPSTADMQFIQRTRPLRAMHTDTITVGPAWATTRAALATPNPGVQATGTSGGAPTSAVYVVTTMRAQPGHRDQLEQVLRRIAALDPGRTVTLQHLEGAAWDFATVTRYDSWAAFAENEATPDAQRLRAQSFRSADGPSLELREHLAEHHDTLAVRVDAAPK